MSVRAASSARALATLAAAVCATLVLVAAVRVADALWPAYGLRLAAYVSSDWTGRVVYRTVDASLSGDLLHTAPFDAWSRYSLEWTGNLAVTAPGTYTFALSSDDGSTLEIDGVLVVDNGGVHKAERRVGGRDLAVGIHPVRLRYVQDGGRASLSVLWATDGEAFSPIPASRLLPDAQTLTGYRWRLVLPIVAALLTVAGLLLLLHRARASLARAAATMATAVDPWLTALARPGVAIAVIVVVGLAVRIAFLTSSPAILWPDSMLFYATMREIVGGDWTSHDAFRTMIYPQMLAVFLWTTRTPQAGTLVVAAQQLMGLASAVLLYLVGRRAFSPLVALAGALVFAGHSLQLVYELTIQTEALFTFALAVLLWVSIRLFDTPTLGRAISTGLALAGLVLVRPVAQWFIVGLAPLAVVAIRPLPRGLMLATVVAVSYALPIVPLMSLNQRYYGFWGVSLGQGLGLYTRVFDIDEQVPPTDTRDPDMRGLWAQARQERWSPNRVHDVLNYQHDYTAASADAAMLAFARETLFAHPWRFAVASAWRWVVQTAAPINSVRVCESPVGSFLCSGRMQGESLPPFPNAPSRPSWVRRAVVALATAGAIEMRVVFVLAVIGGLAFVRLSAGSTARALLGFTILYTTMIPALSQWPQDRYRLPIDGLLFLFAAAGAASVGRAAASFVSPPRPPWP